VDFFESAGMPKDVAEEYAVIFVEHRIQPDMLVELDKDYLREMGIQAMGDVIAILRQAKKVHSADRASKLPSGKPAVVQSQSIPSLPSSSQSEESVKLHNHSELDLMVITGSPGRQRATPASRMIDRIIGNDPDAVPMNISTPVPFKSLPKEYGDDLEKSTAIEQLGDTANVTAPKIMITNLNGSRSISAGNSTTGPSSAVTNNVFSRLGGADSPLRPSSPMAKSLPVQKADAVPYAGVLKSGPVKSAKTKTVTTKTEDATLMSDSVKLSLKDRLGGPSTGTNTLGTKSISQTSSPLTKTSSATPATSRTTTGINKVTAGTSKIAMVNRLGPPPSRNAFEDDDESLVTSSTHLGTKNDSLSLKSNSISIPTKSSNIISLRVGEKKPTTCATSGVIRLKPTPTPAVDVHSRLGKVTKAEASSSSNVEVPLKKSKITIKKPPVTTITQATSSSPSLSPSSSPSSNSCPSSPEPSILPTSPGPIDKINALNQKLKKRGKAKEPTPPMAIKGRPNLADAKMTITLRELEPDEDVDVKYDEDPIPVKKKKLVLKKPPAKVEEPSTLPKSKTVSPKPKTLSPKPKVDEITSSHSNNEGSVSKTKTSKKIALKITRDFAGESEDPDTKKAIDVFATAIVNKMHLGSSSSSIVTPNVSRQKIVHQPKAKDSPQPQPSENIDKVHSTSSKSKSASKSRDADDDVPTVSVKKKKLKRKMDIEDGSVWDRLGGHV